MSKRQLSAYEKNHLLRAGIPLRAVDQFGEMPVEYITGEVSFAGHTFAVSPDVLIPRVETEELVSLVVERAQEYYEAQPHPLTIADIGTGSGALGISVFLELTRQGLPVQLFLSDVSEAALKITQHNWERLTERVQPDARASGGERRQAAKIFPSDLLTEYSTDTKLDVILANLPYIPSHRLSQLDPSVREFEPTLALDGGPDGLQLIAQLLRQAPQYIAPQGEIWLEIDDTHTLQQLQDLTGDFTPTLITDSLGKTRFAHLLQPAPHPMLS